eukprot:tig00021178_g19210.t1
MAGEMDQDAADEALILAAAAGDVRSIRDLLSRGASPNAFSRRPLKRADGKAIPVGRSALHEAAQVGHVEALRTLLDAPHADANSRYIAGPDQSRDPGPAPLDMAAAANRPAAVQLLLDRGADGLQGALFGAVRANSDTGDAVRLLLERGAKAGERELSYAAQAGNAGALRAVLGAMPAGEARTKAIESCGFSAARGGSGEVVRLLAAAGMPPEGEISRDGYTFVGLAAVEGKLETVTALVEMGARIAGIVVPGAKGGPRPDVISWAAEGGDPAVIRYLLSRGADLEARDGEGMTPLLKAAACGHGPAVEALADAGADVAARETGPYGAPLPEGRAARGVPDLAPALSHPGVLRLLGARGIPYDLAAQESVFVRGAFPIVRQKLMRTPLGHAAKRGDAEAVRALLAAGADPNVPATLIQWSMRREESQHPSSTPLHDAASDGFSDVVRLLVAGGADMAARHAGRRPLEAAIAAGRTDAARALLELGCPVDDAAYAAEEEGQRAPEAALPLAAERGDLELVRELLARGASPGARHGHKAGPYELAALGGHFEVLRELVARAAPPAEVVEGIAAGAAREGSAACLRVALDAGADPRRRVKENSAWLTPLLMAAGNGHLGCVRELLERGADPGEVEGVPPPRRTPEQEEEDEAEGRPPPPEYVLAGYSALERAARGGHAAVVRLLASRGAPVDRPDSGLNSALGLAAKEGRLEAVRALLQCGADPANPKALKASGVLDSAWCPALHAAAFNFDIPSVRALLEAGAPINQADASNRTPIMRPLASSAREKEPLMLKTLQELLRAGADPFYGWQDKCTIEQNLLYQVSGMYTKNRLTILAALEEAGLRLPTRHPAVAQALAFALARGVYSVARWFLERKVDTNLAYLSDEERGGPHIRGETLLHKLLMGRREHGESAEDFDACLRLILDNGADVNEYCEGSSPLHLAAGNAEAGAETVRFLIERGAALEAKDAENDEEGRGRGRGRGEARGRTPLLVAVAASKGEDGLETVRALLDAGADIGARDAEGRSAAAIAAAAADLELLRLLMGRGAGRHAHEGEIVAAACGSGGGGRYRRGPETRDILGVLLEDELKEVSAEGFAWPAVRRDADGSLSGRAKGYSTALGEAMRDGSEMAAEDARQWADLLLCCRGPIRLSEIHALKPEETGGDARGPLVAAAARVLRLEGRVEPEPPEDPKKKTKKKAKGQEDEEEEAEQEDPAEADARDRETPLHAACRVGLRLTALRLAAAATPETVDAVDAAEETALSRAVAFGPALFDVCALLLQKGADIGRQVGGADGGKQRAVLDGTRDAAYRAQLKRAAAVRDAFISYGHHPPEVARFTAQLRDRLQAEQVSCWMDEMKATGIEAGTEWREQIGAGIKAARAVLFVASKHSCASDWCMLELSRARDLGRPIFPVWAEAPFPLDDRPAGLLRGCRIVDLSRPALLEAGFPAFLAEVRGALEAAAAADDAADADAARARPSPLTFPALPSSFLSRAQALLARPEARCDPRRAPFLLAWALPEDARNAASLLSALAFRGVPCWLHCPGADPTGEAGADAALAACAAFVPLLSPASASSPLLRDRLQRARAAGRPVRPLLLSSLQVPASLEYSLARTRKFPFFAEEPEGFFPSLDALLSSLGAPAPAAPAKPEGPPALHAPATSAGGAAPSALDAARAGVLQAEIAGSDRELEQLEREIAELEAAAARGSRRGKRGKGSSSKAAPPPLPAPPPLDPPGAAPAAPPRKRDHGKSGACSLM